LRWWLCILLSSGLWRCVAKSRWWRQQVSPKRWCLHTKLHAVTSQKTIVFKFPSTFCLLPSPASNRLSGAGGYLVFTCKNVAVDREANQVRRQPRMYVNVRNFSCRLRAPSLTRHLADYRWGSQKLGLF
jgi:hypothetical protein